MTFSIMWTSAVRVPLSRYLKEVLYKCSVTLHYVTLLNKCLIKQKILFSISCLDPLNMSFFLPCMLCSVLQHSPTGHFIFNFSSQILYFSIWPPYFSYQRLCFS